MNGFADIAARPLAADAVAPFVLALADLPVDPAILGKASDLLESMSRLTGHKGISTPSSLWSLLTPSGYPVEVAFGSPADELRFTTEVGGAGVAPSDRLALAVQRLGHVATPISSGDAAWCAAIQSGALVRWGAWVSLCVGPRGVRRKLYAEVPAAGHESAIDRVEASTHFIDQLIDQGARLIMVGLPEGESWEYYFGLRGLRYSDLPRLLDPVGVPGDGARIVKALETLCGRYLNQSRPNRQSGLSCRKQRDGSLQLTLFCQASDLFLSDAETRRALLRAAPYLGVDLRSYAAFTETLAQDADNTHCMVALTPLPGGRIDLRIGVSPPLPAAAVPLVGPNPKIAAPTE
ncbi:MAG: hypothetical protein V7742_14120 [Halioglobus sp.]